MMTEREQLRYDLRDIPVAPPSGETLSLFLIVLALHPSGSPPDSTE